MCFLLIRLPRSPTPACLRRIEPNGARAKWLRSSDRYRRCGIIQVAFALSGVGTCNPIHIRHGKQALLAPQRRLVAVLAADVVGYGRLTELHEESTHAWLMRLRSEVLDPGIAAYRGNLIKNTGDGFLAMFDSAHDATQYALAMQRTVTAMTAEQPALSLIHI